MVNKDFLNICYKYFNKFINSDELVDNLSNIDKSCFSKEDLYQIEDFITNVKKIIVATPNEVDDYVINEKNTIKKLIDKFENMPKDKDLDYINNQLDSLRKKYDKDIDSHERWFAILNYISNNDFFNNNFDALSDYELLEFIAQYICAPFPPNFSQEEFDRLVRVGIEKDEREWLWRLAFNYYRNNINFDGIVDYYISVKDGYYLAELISVVGQCLDINRIIDNINDKDLIIDLEGRKNVINRYVTDEQFNKLISKISVNN